MLKIRDRSKVPNGLYDYTLPENGLSYRAHSFGLLLAKVRVGYSGNQLPIPENLAELVEQDWCSRRPEHCEDPDAFAHREKEAADVFTQVIAAAAIPAADALAVISKALGINCGGCKTRHRLIREMKRRGVMETIRLVKETFHA